VNKQTFYSYFLPFFISMLPVSELRGGLPLALSQGLSPFRAYLISVIGNTIPVLPLLIGLKSFIKLIKRYKWLKGVLEIIEKKAFSKQKTIQKYGIYGIIFVVMVPLPMTGAWTGSLISALLSIPVKYAFPAIFAGICLAGFIVLFAVTGFFEIGKLLSGM